MIVGVCILLLMKTLCTQEVNQQAVVSQGRKAGVSNLPPHWSDRGNFNENAVPAGVDAPYQSLVVKDPDGKR